MQRKNDPQDDPKAAAGTTAPGAAPRVFQGPLHFVNHTAGSMAARPHRHQVFTHVQSNYRRWKRREDIKSIRPDFSGSSFSMRHAAGGGGSGGGGGGGGLPATTNRLVASAPAPAPVPPPVPAHAGSSSTFSSSPGSDRGSMMINTFPLSPPETASDWSRKERESTESTELCEIIETTQALQKPVTVLCRGNSDPFNAWSFRITPQANDLLKFYRDWVIPSMYHSDSRKAISSKSALLDYSDTLNGLKDEAGAYAFLSRNAFVAAKSNPAMRRLALEYSGKSTALLAKKIKSKKDLQDSTTLWHINNLWAAETIDNNMTGALAHGKMVRHLIEEQVRKGKVDFKQLMYVTYTDSQMSATFMISPVFDVQVWLPRVLAPMWEAAAAAAEKLLKQSPCSIHPINPCLNGSEIASIFLARQQTLNLWTAVQAREEEADQAQLVLLWLVFRAVLTQGRLINLYLQIQEQISSPPRSLVLDEDTMDGLYAQQYLALAGIYLTRMSSLNNTVLGKPMFDAGPGILRRLREVLEASERTPGGPTFQFYIHARFWACYVGALSEQASARALTGTSTSTTIGSSVIASARASASAVQPECQWFNRKFSELALANEITTWTAAEKVLKGFIYNDHLLPHLSTWFDGTLNFGSPSS